MQMIAAKKKKEKKEKEEERYCARSRSPRHLKNNLKSEDTCTLRTKLRSNDKSDDRKKTQISCIKLINKSLLIIWVGVVSHPNIIL